MVKASIQNYFRELVEDFNATYYGFYFLEFADYYCQENNDEREMLKLLYQSLRALVSSAYDNRLVCCIYELKAMSINGEGPNVFSCLQCGKKEALHYFATERGGTLCDSCGMEEKQKYRGDVFVLDESTVYTMQYIIASRIAISFLMRKICFTTSRFEGGRALEYTLFERVPHVFARDEFLRSRKATLHHASNA